jgi:hypothetical protein
MIPMSKMLALVVRTDNTTERLEVAESELSEAISNAVGGLFTHVTIHKSLDFWANDNGFAENLSINAVATQMYAELGGRTPIVGDVVFTGGTNAGGYSLSLDRNYATALEVAAKLANKLGK